MPFYSICIPVYNRAHTVLRTLDSIRKQSFSDYEVLIIDDGSSDNSAAVINEYIAEHQLDKQFHFIYKENGGKHTALNCGIAHATGIFFVILDSDDWFSPNALSDIYDVCMSIRDDESCCGVMGRCVDSSNGEMIGDPFDLSMPMSSYFDFHFLLPSKIKIGDSVEFIKTSILQQFRFPEPDGCKFVPEAWLFDQIGVKYSLLLTNQILKYIEYQEEGITKDTSFKQKNAVGFLYHYISRLETILPHAPISGVTLLKLYIIAWWRYWTCVALDNGKIGPRVTRISMLGYFVRFFTPVLNWVYKLKYADLVSMGR